MMVDFAFLEAMTQLLELNFYCSLYYPIEVWVSEVVRS
jgi:hypothetical protein